MRKVNLFDCELGERYERGTIANRGAALGPLIGAAKIGAGLYELEADRWVWPYHYHHGVEEWLYVVAGAPVLRDPHGERTLTQGDLVCFPAGHAGAHTVAGPGRFVIFSAGGWPAPSISVYPDSDKVGSRPGDTGIPGLDNLNFRREDAVDYWYREGSDEPAERPELVRPPAPKPDDHETAVVNVATLAAQPLPVEIPDGFRGRIARLAPLLGSERLGATLCELDQRQGSAPYHCEYGREEWLLVLAGLPTLRHPEGEDLLAPGDLVCFAEGPEGAHRVLNHSPEPTRMLFFSTQELPFIAEYPDSRKLMVRYASDQAPAVFRLRDQVSYWDDEG